MKYIISSLLTVQWRQAYPHGCVTVTHVSRFIAFDFKVHLSSSIYMSSSCISALSQALMQAAVHRVDTTLVLLGLGGESGWAVNR